MTIEELGAHNGAQLLEMYRNRDRRMPGELNPNRKVFKNRSFYETLKEGCEMLVEEDFSIHE